MKSSRYYIVGTKIKDAEDKEWTLKKELDRHSIYGQICTINECEAALQMSTYLMFMFPQSTWWQKVNKWARYKRLPRKYYESLQTAYRKCKLSKQELADRKINFKSLTVEQYGIRVAKAASNRKTVSLPKVEFLKCQVKT